MKARTLILLIVILPLLVWGAVKGFIWYSLDASFKNIQARVSHLADLSYRDVRTPVMGPIGYTSVTIRPKGYKDVIKVGSILVHWKEPKEIIPILEAFFNKALPPRLEITANNVSFSLDSDLGDVLLQPARWDWESPLTFPPSVWGCGNGTFQAADYRALEYGHLSINARLEYSLSPGTNALKFFLRLRNPGMTSFLFEGSIPLKSKQMPTVQQLSSPGLKLADLSYTVQDESYNEKKIAYCAKKNGVSATEFVDGQISRISADLEQINLYPSTELSNAYRSHLAEGTRVTVNLTPFEPAGINELAQIAPGNLVDWLGISVVANDVPISELFVDRKDLVEEEEEDEEESQQTEEAFNPTPFAELSEHLNRLARVTTGDGKVHYAYIESTAPEKLTLTRHLVGGSATFELEFSEIVEVAVLY